MAIIYGVSCEPDPNLPAERSGLPVAHRASLTSIYRKMRPRVGTEHSDPLRRKLARSSSAANHSRFSISVLFSGTKTPSPKVCVVITPIGSVPAREGSREMWHAVSASPSPDLGSGQYCILRARNPGSYANPWPRLSQGDTIPTKDKTR